MINDWYKKYTWNLSWSINIYWLIIYNPSCFFFAAFHVLHYAVHDWFVCSTPLICLQYTLGLSAVHHWFVCGTPLICLQCTIDLSAVHHWFVCSTPLICLQYSLYLFTVLPLFVYNTKKLQNKIVGSYVTLIIFIKQLISLF